MLNWSNVKSFISSKEINSCFTIKELRENYNLLKKDRDDVLRDANHAKLRQYILLIKRGGYIVSVSRGKYQLVNKVPTHFSSVNPYLILKRNGATKSI